MALKSEDKKLCKKNEQTCGGQMSGLPYQDLIASPLDAEEKAEQQLSQKERDFAEAVSLKQGSADEKSKTSKGEAS